MEYSHDAGVTWNLVEEQCYSGSECDGSAHEASVYFSGFYGKWRRVLVPVTHHLAQKCVFSFPFYLKYTMKPVICIKFLKNLKKLLLSRNLIQNIILYVNARKLNVIFQFSQTLLLKIILILITSIQKHMLLHFFTQR